MKKAFRYIIVCVVLLTILAGISVCAENKQTKQAVAQPVKDQTVKSDDVLAMMKNNLDNEEDILGFMPAIKKNVDAEGKVFYTYNGTKLEELGKEDLKKLSVRVGQIVTKIRTDRIQRQLRVADQAGRSLAPRNVTTAPSVAQPPRTPTPPPSTPKPVSPPPAPPTRR